MKKIALLSIFGAFVFSIPTFAGVRSWFSAADYNGGLKVYDRWDSAKDTDATGIFEALQMTGQRVDQRIIKSVSSNDEQFSVTCVMDLYWYESECRFTVRKGDHTVIDGKAGILTYQVEGETARKWHKILSETDEPFQWVSFDGTSRITSSMAKFEFTYREKRRQ